MYVMNKLQLGSEVRTLHFVGAKENITIYGHFKLSTFSCSSTLHSPSLAKLEAY